MAARDRFVSALPTVFDDICSIHWTATRRAQEHFTEPSVRLASTVRAGLKGRCTQLGVELGHVLQKSGHSERTSGLNRGRSILLHRRDNLPRGVFRFRSADEAFAQRVRWENQSSKDASP